MPLYLMGCVIWLQNALLQSAMKHFVTIQVTFMPGSGEVLGPLGLCFRLSTAAPSVLNEELVIEAVQLIEI